MIPIHSKNSLLARKAYQQHILSMEDLARMLGISSATVNSREDGRAKPSPLAQKQIGDFLRGLGEKGRDPREEFLGAEA